MAQGGVPLSFTMSVGKNPEGCSMEADATPATSTAPYGLTTQKAAASDYPRRWEDREIPAPVELIEELRKNWMGHR